MTCYNGTLLYATLDPINVQSLHSVAVDHTSQNIRYHTPLSNVHQVDPVHLYLPQPFHYMSMVTDQLNTHLETYVLP